jgi:hypothetical protein
VAIYIRDTLQHSSCLEMASALTQHFESSIWVRVRLSTDTSLVVGNIYISLNSDKDNNNHLIESLKIADNLQDSQLLMIGDFNLPRINWLSGVKVQILI